MTERVAIIGRDFRLFINDAEILETDDDVDAILGRLGSATWHELGSWDPCVSIEIQDKAVLYDLDVPPLALMPRPKTHPRSPRESLRRGR